jgi:hypothetical protein
MTRRAIDTESYATNHLVYEIQMVAGLAARFDRFAKLLPSLSAATSSVAEREVLDLVGRNADIEAFAVHCRVLIHFLYGTKDDKRDCVARDFFLEQSVWPTMRPKKPRVLSFISERAGIEIAHLSYDRKNPAPPWDYAAIWNALAEVLRVFVEGADLGRLGRNARDQVRSLVAPPTTDELQDVINRLERVSRQAVIGATQNPYIDSPYLEVVDGPGTAVVKPKMPQPPLGD